MTHRRGSKQNNIGKQYTPEQIKLARKLVKQNTPTPLIADALGRTEEGIRSKMSELGVSLNPINKSPYTRRKN